MKYIIFTLGCKVNQYETRALEELLADSGARRAAEGETADVVIVNSCAVTAESGRKSRQAVRRLKEENPGALSVVCGCWSQVEPGAAESLGADIVFGSGDRRKLAGEILSRCASGDSAPDGALVEIDRPFERREFEELAPGAFDGHARAYMKIEDGCQNFCTYCIIPYARGRVRSLPAARAAGQAEYLQAQGYREIVLTGIEIASYGADLPGKPSLADLVCAVAQAAPLVRIRLGSLEPTVITEDFCRSLSETGRVCPHFHLSVQSGCDRTLKAMNRKYDTAFFFSVTGLLRRYFPGCALTGDLITGFPGETEEDHRETLEFIEKCAFASMHIFPYSRRPGTPADRMREQNTNAVKSRRASEAHALADRMKNEYMRSCVGRRLPVIFERNEGGFSYGHADNYMPVRVPGERPRRVVETVEIADVSSQMLVGLVV